MNTIIRESYGRSTTARRYKTRMIPSLRIWKARREAFERLDKITRQWSLESWLHQKRTGVYTHLLLEALFSRPDRLSHQPGFADALNGKSKGAILYAAYLHDVGEAAEPDAFPLERPSVDDLIQRHTTGFDGIIDGNFDKRDALYYRTLGEVCRHHHERWDGRGYPDDLSGTEIPLSARIVAVADAYDMVSGRQMGKRPYSHEKAAKIVKAGKGKQFDPHIVELFDEIEEQFYNVGKALSKGNGIRNLG